MRIFGTVFLFVCTFSLSASVTVTENNYRRLSFTFQLTGFSITTIRKAGGDFSQLSFSSANTVLPGSGDVMLPSLSLYAGVPQTGRVTAYFVSHSVKRVVLDHPLCSSNDSVAIDNASPAFDIPWLSTPGYLHYRDLRTAHFYLRPFLYDSSTRTLTILEKGSCTIEFPDAPVHSRATVPSKSDFYSMIKSMILNYDVAKNWIETKKPLSKRMETRWYLPANEKMMVRFKIGDGNSGVNEGTTNENGIIRIKGSDMSPFITEPVSVNKIAFFASYKEELDSVVPEPGSIPAGVKEIPILRFDLNNNGLFDPDDYFLAYVSGVCDWYYDTAKIVDTSDSSKRDFAFNQNRVENFRYYWIRVNGAGSAINKFACSVLPEDTVTCFEDRIRYKMSKSLTSEGGGVAKGGINWIWKRLDDDSKTFSYAVNTADVIPDSTGYIRINKGEASCDDLSMFLGGPLESKVGMWNKIPTWLDGTNDSFLTLSITLQSSQSYFEIESFDIKYRCSLDMKSRKRLRVYSPLDSGFISYRLSNVPAGRMFIFRISPYESAISLIDTVLTGGSYLWTDTTGRGIQYYICTESGLLNTPALEKYIPSDAGTYEIKDLRSGNNTADYLIITHPDFRIDALRLAEHKYKFSAKKFKSPRFVSVDDIYREFSGGSRDPAAIRNFLLYVDNAANWAIKPEYVLLFGNGHFDYKGYSTQESNHIPTAQFKQYYWKCMEDFFACITPGELIVDNTAAPDLFLGRIPCATATEAQYVVNKIIDMEGPEADYTGWRNRILLVSDDDRQGGGYDGIKHYAGNEDIEENLKQERPYIDVRKVILFEYPWNELYHKPEAASALINGINNGVSCVNFFGHGNEQAWADENIFNKDKMGILHNCKYYPIVNAFSCAVGYFDKPDESCLSDLFVTAKQAGAIATISSTRTAYAGPNTDMAKTFYKYYYNKDSSRTIGQAYAVTKATDNLKHYALLGDPSIRYMRITDTVELEVLSQQADSLKALERITVRGTVKRNNVLNGSFGSAEKPASVLIGLYNPDQDSVTRKDGGISEQYIPLYSLPGTPLFIGVVEVKNGLFEQKIQVPKRVTFGKQGAKLTAYAWYNGEDFGVGYKGGLIFSGTDTTNIVFDNSGPRITIRPVYENEATWNTPVGFTDKISGFLPMECEISVWDESGIDVTGTGPDEGLSIEIDGMRERQNINNKFKFDQGEYTRGRANIVFERGELKPGQYTMTIRAQDLSGNCTKTGFTLEVLSDDDFKLGHVFNYPNPVRMNGSVKFYFYHSNLSEQWHGKVEATIKIFTLSGKLIRVFHNAINGQEWDLTDQRGNRLTPNVYLYRVSAKMLTADITGKEKVIKSPVKKLVIHPPG